MSKRHIHHICVECYNTKHPDRPVSPTRELSRAHWDLCCWCGNQTCAGLMQSEDPATAPCHGKCRV